LASATTALDFGLPAYSKGLFLFSLIILLASGAGSNAQSIVTGGISGTVMSFAN